MPCEAPRTAYRPANGGPILFKPPTDGHAYNTMQVPCGTCYLCRQEQARQTAVRIYHEAQQHADNCFLTLTYAPDKEPPHGELNYADLVKFWKRLRKRLAKRSQTDRMCNPRLRYYAAGEYGDRSFRPHYHACVFGHAFLDQRIVVRTTPSLLWTTPELIDCWGLGHVSVGDLSFASARYTASYVVKKLRSKQKYVRLDKESGELIEMVQPRGFWSKNLGKSWWTQWHQQTIHHDHVIIDGKPQKPPKMYDRWLKEKAPEIMEQIKENRKEKALENKQTEEQTRARARNARARTKPTSI